MTERLTDEQLDEVARVASANGLSPDVCVALAKTFAELRELRSFKASMLEAFRDAAFFHRRADSDEHVRWESEEDARNEAEDEIEAMLDGESGWPEEGGYVSHGVLLYLSSAVEANHRRAPEGNKFEYFCDVVLKDEPYAGALLRAIDEAHGVKP